MADRSERSQHPPGIHSDANDRPDPLQSGRAEITVKQKPKGEQKTDGNIFGIDVRIRTLRPALFVMEHAVNAPELQVRAQLVFWGILEALLGKSVIDPVNELTF